MSSRRRKDAGNEESETELSDQGNDSDDNSSVDAEIKQLDNVGKEVEIVQPIEVLKVNTAVESIATTDNVRSNKDNLSNKKQNEKMSTKKDPSFVPRSQQFFLHDDRDEPIGKGDSRKRNDVHSSQGKQARSLKNDDNWGHDKFEELISGQNDNKHQRIPSSAKKSQSIGVASKVSVPKRSSDQGRSDGKTDMPPPAVRSQQRHQPPVSPNTEVNRKADAQKLPGLDGHTAGVRVGAERRPKGHKVENPADSDKGYKIEKPLDSNVVVQRTSAGTIFDGSRSKKQPTLREYATPRENVRERADERRTSGGPPASLPRSSVGNDGRSGDARNLRDATANRTVKERHGDGDWKQGRKYTPDVQHRSVSSTTATSATEMLDVAGTKSAPSSPAHVKGPPPGLESVSLNPTARIFQPTPSTPSHDLSPSETQSDGSGVVYDSQQFVNNFSSQQHTGQDSRGANIQYNLHPDYSGLPSTGGAYTQQDLQVLAAAQQMSAEMGVDAYGNSVPLVYSAYANTSAAVYDPSVIYHMGGGTVMADGSSANTMFAADGSVWYSAPDMSVQQSSMSTVYYPIAQQQNIAPSTGQQMSYVSYAPAPPVHLLGGSDSVPSSTDTAAKFA